MQNLKSPYFANQPDGIFKVLNKIVKNRDIKYQKRKLYVQNNCTKDIYRYINVGKNMKNLK